MLENKLDLILGKLISLEKEVSEIRQDFGGLKQDVSGLKQDFGGLKQDVSGLKQDVATLMARADRHDARIDEVIAAFREHWGDVSGLYRRLREDVKLFEDRLEAKISQVNQSVVALKDSIERQDYRSDTLARRITALEEPRQPTFDR